MFGRFGKFGRIGKKKIERLPEDQVHLKPLFGIRPGVYLAGIYGIIMLVILFFILLYPGLSNPGSLVVVTAEPEGAAIWVDGVYRAVAPAAIFVPKGTHRIAVNLPAFTEWSNAIEVPGRAFASLPFPKKVPVKVRLEAPDPAAVLNRGAAEYAAWSFAGEPTAVYQIPLSLSEAAYRAAYHATDAAAAADAPQGNAAALSAMNETLEAASRFASTAAAARDLIRSKYLIDNAGRSPSPLTLLSSTQDMLSFLSKNPDAAGQLASLITQLVSPEAASILTGSAWYANAQNAGRAAQTQPPSGEGEHRMDEALDVNGVPFYPVPRGALSQGGRVFTIESFSIAATEILPAWWEAFLAANPEWKQEHAANLVSRGLVTEDYLADDRGNTSAASFAPLTGVSWYAAKAYCAWLSTFLEDTGYEVRLPYEREWEYAAVNGLFPTTYPPFMPDGVEPERTAVWCEDHFAPFNAISAKSASIAAVGSPERSVRGGKYMKAESRGSLPPDFCVPFVSFRPVIAKKGANYE
ncbi:MAG: SUMF1/EgtB/PvdO family nonheme iron enzyme [Treponema sp.]|jgi:hypothetical protein|nr:SUMF1/EgtB/PvdO family nonheme iron enzyme [Treponema sp.]